MKQEPRTSRLRLEHLEQRHLLAGDVDVTSIGGILHIRGDNADNGVAIISASPGIIGVAGISQGGSATTINGQTSRLFIRVSQILIELNNGNDALVMTKLVHVGSVIVRTGEGNDFVGLGEFNNNSYVDSIVNSSLDSLIISTNMAVDMGSGNDTVVARKVAAKSVTLLTGEGDDSVLFDRQGNFGDSNYVPGVTAVAAITISGGQGENTLALKGLTAQRLTVLLGAAEDTLTLEKSTIFKATTISGDDGGNSITLDEVTSKSLLVSMGQGNDDVTFSQLTCIGGITVNDNFGNDHYEFDEINAGSLSIAAGFGDDEVTLNDVTANRGIQIDSGEGNDTVDLTAVVARSLYLELDAGNDELTLDHVAIDKKLTVNGGLGNDLIDFAIVGAGTLEVLLDWGDDEISLDSVQVNKKAKIDGGPDFNTYTDLGNNTLPLLKRTYFQTIV